VTGVARRREARTIQLARRAAIVGACYVAYAIAFFPAWRVLGGNAGTLTIVPVIAAGWTFGVLGGIGGTVVGLAVTWLLVAQVHPDPLAVFGANALSIAAGFGIGGATGWVRGVLAALRRQTHRLQQRHARALLEAGLRKAAEEELRRVNGTLEKACDAAVHASNEKSRFLARASHELRTPLAAIQGYAELLIEESEVRGAPPATLARDLGRIVEAARHLTGLVDELLDISKIETGRMELRLAPVDLKAIVEDVAAMVQPAAAVAGTRLRVDCAADLPRVRTDARRARQVLLNLLSNAIKFTGAGDVDVIAKRALGAPEEWAEIEVRDTGPGMTADEQRLAFEEFWRGRTDRPGVGLGLSIAQRLCRELGGSIGVNAAPGAGAAFIVRLPVATGPDAAAGP
jgi:signal transduction histidine kinase